MAHEKYKRVGEIEDRIIEECGEVIQAYGKAKRFGWNNYHPDRRESNNRMEFTKEVEDLANVCNEYLQLRKSR